MRNYHSVFFGFATLTYLMIPMSEWEDLKELMVPLALLFAVGFIVPRRTAPVHIGYLDLAILVLASLSVLCWLWTDHPTLTWMTTMHWLTLFAVYIIGRSINLRQFDQRHCTLMFMSVNLLNYILLTYVLAIVIRDHPEAVLTSFNTSLNEFYGVNANYYASLMVIALPFYVKILDWNTGLKRIVWIFMTVHVLFILLFTSKGALFALLLLTVFLVLNRRHLFSTKYLWRSSILVIVALMLLFSITRNPFKTIRQLNPVPALSGDMYDERTKIWNRCVEIIGDHPIAGVGSGHWPLAFLSRGVSEFQISFDSPRYYRHAHNFLLQTSCELGVFGGSLLFLLFAAPFFYLLRDGPDPHLREIIPYLLAFMVVSCFYGVVYVPDRYHIAQMVWVFALGLIPVDSRRSVFHLNIWSGKFIFILLTSLLSLWGVFILVHDWGLEKLRHLNRTDQKELAIEQIETVYSSYFFRYHGVIPLKTYESLVLWRMSKKEAGLLAMQESLADNPFHYPNWFHLGNMLGSFHRRDEAKSAYKRAFEINPNYFPTRLALAQIALIERDWISFDHYLSFYEEWLIPLKTRFDYEASQNSENPVIRSFWRKVLRYEETILKLRSRKAELDQI